MKLHYNKYGKRGMKFDITDTKSLIKGDGIFSYNNIKNFKSDLNDLQSGMMMFMNCPNLSSFSANVSSLVNGQKMFQYCRSLNVFSGSLESLLSGYCMFDGCDLQKESIINIASSLKDIKGIDKINDDIWGEIEPITRGVIHIDWNGSEDISEQIKTMKDKGWFVFVNGDQQFDWNVVEGSEYITNTYIWNSSNKSFSNDEIFCVEDGAGYNKNGQKLFLIDCDKIMSGHNLFLQCTNLEKFNDDLSSLKNGQEMFRYCSNIKSFNTDLTSLNNGYAMFSNIIFDDFSIDMPNLKYGNYMFAHSDLKAFTADISQLVSGDNMFWGCNNLDFNSSLSSLVTGDGMFFETASSPQNVKNILDNIRDIRSEKESLTDDDYVIYDDDKDTYSKEEGWLKNGTYHYSYHDNNNILTTDNIQNVGKISIDVNINYNGDEIYVNRQSFCQEIGYETWEYLEQAFRNKGWVVQWSYLSDMFLDIYKYNSCVDISDIKFRDATYYYDIEDDGSWNCYLDSYNPPKPTEGSLDESLFYNIQELKSFNVNLPSLVNGNSMFYGCENLLEFTSSMANLEDGTDMFRNCSSLTKFESETPLLEDGTDMFSSCINLVTFNGNLSKMKYAVAMFYACKNLVEFDEDLGSLEDGTYMFGHSEDSCSKLNLASLQSIANSIKNLSAEGKTGKITIGLDNSLSGNSQVQSEVTKMQTKGWQVEIFYPAM